MGRERDTGLPLDDGGRRARHRTASRARHESSEDLLIDRKFMFKCQREEATRKGKGEDVEEMG